MGKDHAARLAAHLAASGSPAAPWHEHCTAVPRHHFNPDVAWAVRMGTTLA